MVEDILSKIREYMFSSDVDKKTVQELFLSDEYLKVQYDEKFVQELINIFTNYFGEVSDSPEDIEKYTNIVYLELVISYGVEYLPELLHSYLQQNLTELWEDMSMDYYEDQENCTRINSFHVYHHIRSGYSNDMPSTKKTKIIYQLDEDLRLRNFYENPPSNVSDFYSFHCEYRIMDNPGLCSNILINLIAFWFMNNDVDSRIAERIYDILKLGEIATSPNGIVYKPLKDVIDNKYKTANP